MRRRLLLLALLLPVACATQDPSDAALVLQDVLATHQANLAGVGAVPPAGGAPAARPEPGLPAGQPALRATPRTPGSGNVTLAGQLVGQTPQDVVQLLGEPRLRRAEGPAEIWHYQAPQCHLDVFLYREDGARGGLRVAYAAARADGTARRGEAACLRDIARGATAPGAAPLVGLGA